MRALVCHQGEIARNPYHLSLPARLMHNACRGAEITQFGGEKLDFPIAELYRLSRIKNGKQKEINKETRIIPPGHKLTLAKLKSMIS